MRTVAMIGAASALLALCGGCTEVEYGEDVDGAVDGGVWQTAPLSEAPRSVTETFRDAAFPHTLPEAPRERINPIWRGWTSSRALVSQGDKLYVADEDNGQIVVLDRRSGEVLRRVALEGRPHHLVVAPSGTIFVSLKHSGQVARISAGASSPDAITTVGVNPRGMAMTTDKRFVAVAIKGSDAVVLLDARTLNETARTEVKAPVAVVMQKERLFATGRDQTRNIIVDGGAFSVSNDRSELRRNTPMDREFFNGREHFIKVAHVAGASADPETEDILVAHRQMLPGNEESSINELIAEAEGFEGEEGDGGYGGGVETEFPELLEPEQPAVSKFNGSAARQQPSTLPVIDPMTREPMTGMISQPSDIHHHPTWTLAFMTGFGSDNVLVFNTAAPDPMAAPIAILDVGKAPRAVTFSEDGRRAYILNAHDYTISEIDLAPIFRMEKIDATQFESFDRRLRVTAEPRERVQPIHIDHDRVTRFGQDPLDAVSSRGRRVFTFTNHSGLSDGQLACATCHPEGSEDGVVWFIKEGPRQTPSLAGRLIDTAPYNWGGTEHTLGGNMQQTVERMGGAGLSPTDLIALERFLIFGLKPAPNPHLRPGGLTDAQLRGKALYEDPQVGCANCHFTDGRADGNNHDVGTMSDAEHFLQDIRAEFTDDHDFEPIRYNTPSLRNLWNTEPYLHDGSAPTLLDVLDRTARTMGRTDHLTRAQKQDLVAYLLTL